MDQPTPRAPTMPTAQATKLLGPVHTFVTGEQARQQSDGQLLQRFAAQREEDAFAVLLRRHGPLVLGVCRRVLHDPNDAEDAFQATFLTLARKAGSIRKQESLSTWLYQVAYHEAARVLGRTATRQKHEREAPPRMESDPLAELSARELLAALDEELHGLPERYRAPLVLCHLQERTCDEAA